MYDFFSLVRSTPATELLPCHPLDEFKHTTVTSRNVSLKGNEIYTISAPTRAEKNVCPCMWIRLLRGKDLPNIPSVVWYI